MFSKPVNEVHEIKKFHRSIYENMNDFYISEDDIKKVLKRLKGSASPGPDGIYSWCYKYGGKFMLECLCDCYNKSLKERNASLRTRVAWISPTWKGDNKQIPLTTDLLL